MTVLLPLIIALASAVPRPQAGTSGPPPLVHASGGFRARRLADAPAIDGRTWVAADVRTGPLPSTVHPANDEFTVTVADAGEDTGDFVRYRLLLTRRGSAPVRIDNEFSAWVYVTPDSRYVFTEPLYVLDVQAWRQYALFEALGIPNYTSIEAISRDGRRLLISRRDCAMDCADRTREYYELTLPE